MISALTSLSPEGGQSRQNTGVKKDGNKVEMMAFMKMFMDLVGLFNDEAEISTEGRTAGGNTVNTEPFTHSPDDNVVE